MTSAERQNGAGSDWQRGLSNHFEKEQSTKLRAVYDAHLGLTVSSWRNNGDIADHPLHSMVSRVGGFPPSLARYFIAKYSRPGGVILDPFCGKGTSLFEAACMGRSPVGGDIAPDAVVVSRAKCNPPSISEVANYLARLKVDRCKTLTDVPDNVAIFFSRHTLSQIIGIRHQLLEDMQTRSKSKLATFICGVMLGILHGHSKVSLSLPCNQAFAMAPAYVRRYAERHGLARPDRNVRDCLLQKSLQLLPAPPFPFRCDVHEAVSDLCGDYVRHSHGKAHMVITSPPYLARQTYLKDGWLRLWFLDRDRSEIKPRSLETGNVSIFVKGIQSFFAAVVGILVPRGKIILVCGSAKVTRRGRDIPVRISDLCLHALNASPHKGSLAVEGIIADRVLMKRGSYFAVHAGRIHGRNGQKLPRYGEDEILILKKT